jgi:MFS family permease
MTQTGPEQRLLPVLDFVVGTASLGAEITAARLLAPYFGASTIVWANTIGVVLVALSVGYWFGGRFADRHPHMRGLCLLVLVASLLIAVVPFAARPFLSLSVNAFDSISLGGFAGSLVGVLALVAVPVTLLGAAAPWAVRLAVADVEGAGQVVGRLYAISTAGSLFGTMAAALLLIPLLGTQRTFLVFSLALALVAAAGLGWRFAAVPAARARPPARIAILGNAAGTVARAFGHFFPRPACAGGLDLYPARCGSWRVRRLRALPHVCGAARSTRTTGRRWSGWSTAPCWNMRMATEGMGALGRARAWLVTGPLGRGLAFAIDFGIALRRGLFRGGG